MCKLWKCSSGKRWSFNSDNLQVRIFHIINSNIHFKTGTFKLYEIWDFSIGAYYWKRLETNLFILDKQFKVMKTHTWYVLLTQNEPKHLLSNTCVESTCVALTTQQKFGAVGSLEILCPRPSQNFSAMTAEILRSVRHDLDWALAAITSYLYKLNVP